ncbi:unnamed protein product [Vitrella brassicaformis CCMP3155]|uniref:Glycoside hydrolase family 3 N-terminal domain-containing protein n=1 Tax=Vitrella brassicaformis (strain CCMP3155) TaxID=1169540 RepID=A0A0G4GXM0_VITBC|nr:unnamed protein product [Vitrella brassicaformis CCMP3155]|eukprot:CEM35726.1 unnamed protein product [Vitrella brassicaformis CCMP3155]
MGTTVAILGRQGVRKRHPAQAKNETATNSLDLLAANKARKRPASSYPGLRVISHTSPQSPLTCSDLSIPFLSNASVTNVTLEDWMMSYLVTNSEDNCPLHATIDRNPTVTRDEAEDVGGKPAHDVQAVSKVSKDAPMEAAIEDLVSRMTVKEKVIQIVMMLHSSVEPEQPKDYPLGAVLSGGGFFGGNDLHRPFPVVQQWLTQQGLRIRELCGGDPHASLR